MTTPNRQREHWAARNAVQYASRSGQIPPAQSCLCADCGQKAREYDHYAGYERENRRKVEPVCRSCHMKRTWQRGERSTTNRTHIQSLKALGVTRRAHFIGICYWCFRPFKSCSEQKRKVRKMVFCSKSCAFHAKRAMSPESCGVIAKWENHERPSAS